MIFYVLDILIRNIEKKDIGHNIAWKWLSKFVLQNETKAVMIVIIDIKQLIKRTLVENAIEE